MFFRKTIFILPFFLCLCKTHTWPKPLSDDQLLSYPKECDDDLEKKISNCKKIPKIYLINLDKSKDRLEIMNHQFQQNSLSFERFPAILGSQFKYEQFKKGIQDLNIEKGYQYEYISDIYQNGLTPGEIGNHLSNYELWKTIEKTDEVSIVLEDDAILLDNFDKRIKSIIHTTPEDFDLIFLYISDDCINRNNDKITSNRRFIRIEKICMPGLVGYLVNGKKGAQKLLKHAMPLHMPSDVRIGRLFGEIKAYTAYPNPIHHGIQPSTIQQLGRPH